MNVNDPVEFCEMMRDEWNAVAQRFLLANSPIPASAHDQLCELFARAKGDGTPLRPGGLFAINALLDKYLPKRETP